jgi:hypothetical protein
MATAGEVLGIWSNRLNMNQHGVTAPWTPALRHAVERLIENLKALEPPEPVELDADLNRSPMAKLVRSRTGEILGEIDMLPVDTSVVS